MRDIVDLLSRSPPPFPSLFMFPLSVALLPIPYSDKPSPTCCLFITLSRTQWIMAEGNVAKIDDSIASHYILSAFCQSPTNGYSRRDAHIPNPSFPALCCCMLPREDSAAAIKIVLFLIQLIQSILSLEYR
jgi:hypothetical protein